MRTFYIFKINKILNPMYERKTNNLFKMLNRINNLDIKEYNLAKKMYSKIIVPIDKKKIDNYLIMNHINDIYYTKHNNVHSLKTSLEISRLKIYNTYLKIETTSNISSFFRVITSLNKDLFVVDFNNSDYFYLDDLKNKITC